MKACLDARRAAKEEEARVYHRVLNLRATQACPRPPRPLPRPPSAPPAARAAPAPPFFARVPRPSHVLRPRASQEALQRQLEALREPQYTSAEGSFPASRRRPASPRAPSPVRPPTPGGPTRHGWSPTPQADGDGDGDGEDDDDEGAEGEGLATLTQAQRAHQLLVFPPAHSYTPEQHRGASVIQAAARDGRRARAAAAAEAAAAAASAAAASWGATPPPLRQPGLRRSQRRVGEYTVAESIAIAAVEMSATASDGLDDRSRSAGTPA